MYEYTEEVDEIALSTKDDKRIQSIDFEMKEELVC